MSQTIRQDKRHGKRRFKALMRPSIRTYLIIMNMIMLGLLFPTVSFFFLHEVSSFRDVQLERALKQMHKSLESRGASLARSMALSAGQAVAGYDFTFLNIMVRQVVENDPEIHYCVIMDAERKAKAHSDPSKVGSVLDSPLDMEAAALLRNAYERGTKPESDTPEEVNFLEGSRIEEEGVVPTMEVIAPIYSGDHLWGGLRVGYSLTGLQKETKRVEAEWADKLQEFSFHFFSMSAIFFCVGVLVAALFTRSFARSADRLREGVVRVAEGDLNHAIEQEGLVCDEIMELSDAFNTMTLKLRESYEELDQHRKTLAQKVAEKTRELREAQENLIQQAHEAGMAEMAVGILHNIGNAITPAKVGTALLAKRLTQATVRRHLPEALSQVGEVVAESDTMSPSEKERLLSIIRLLPESLEEELDRIGEELERIRSKHEHIEGIINLQMRYAKLFGNAEAIDISRLADDALQMLHESLDKRGVTVVRKFEQVPPVQIEGAKLMQILINLIKNGFEAMDSVPEEKRTLILSTRYEEGPPGYVVFAIRDTGVGFGEEEKAKLFKFGYSSKERGSGFGLHSCANYLIAHRGSITAHSDGPGKGAEFVVRLPVIGTGQGQ